MKPASLVAAQRSPVRRGFTLTELMIVILIIAILSTLFLGALGRAEESARRGRTRSLINKLHNMLMSRWDTYRSARLPIVAEMKGTGVGSESFDASNDKARYRANVARRRMFAVRELMRMEMPDRYDDLTFTPVVLTQPGSTKPFRSTMWLAYHRRINAAKNGNPRTRNLATQAFIRQAALNYEAAECLYLILTTGLDRSDVSTEHLSPQDSGDKDFDGMPEFHDGWGNPIEFLRWAPGLVSQLQPMFRYPTKVTGDVRYKMFHSKQPVDPNDGDFIISRWNITIDKVLDPTASKANTSRTLVDRTVVVPQEDLFNPLRVSSKEDKVVSGKWQASNRWRPGMEPPESGYTLYPFIYSYGPNGTSGIEHCCRSGVNFDYVSSPSDGNPSGIDNIKLSDPYAVYKDPSTSANMYRGASIGNGAEFDNIHNHQAESP